MKTVATSGFFNPLHIGHLRYLKEAKRLGDKLVVIVNTDEQVRQKVCQPFMKEQERLEIVKAIRWVDEAILAIDKDGTVRETLKMLKPDIFAKGGDSTIYNVPELDICNKLGIEIIFGVGGGKIQSSNWLLSRIKENGRN